MELLLGKIHQVPIGEKAVMSYRIDFVIWAGFGAVMELALVWTLADIFNKLMALPNPIGFLALSPIIVSEIGFLLWEDICVSAMLTDISQC